MTDASSASDETVGSAALARSIYAYTVVGKDRETWTRTVAGVQVSGVGQIKVGETSKPTARERIAQQLNTAYPGLKGVEILLHEPAVRHDGTPFRDGDVHRVLEESGIRRVGGEWFEATLDEVRAAIVAVRSGKRFSSERTNDFAMRPEQEDAVALTAGYFTARKAEDPTRAPRFLWNAKMRFGKTFTSYQLAREMGWKRLLVLTFKPAVQTAWKEDLLGHVDFEGWEFLDKNTASEAREELADSDAPLVCFASFQDLGGLTAEGKVKTHNEVVHLIDWDCIVIDEYHFGAWRDTARDLYDPVDGKLAEVEEPDDRVTDEDLGLTAQHYLYLSGTPFRAIATGEFTEDQIFNWTYPQEQEAKEAWDPSEGPNPYVDLPGMQIYCYTMGDDATEYAIDGEFNSFDLNAYFKAERVDKKSKSIGPGAFVFEDPERVSEFLNMLRGKLTDQMKMQIVGGQKAPFPYEATAFAEAIRHSVWYLRDVASCFAMRDLLEGHSAFRDYEIVVAAGGGVGLGAAALPPVEDAIQRADDNSKPGSITLSCGKLMTGVTVPQWGAIFMLRSLKSPESYFQAAFRIQSPWSRREGDGTVVVFKNTCYVFEFDPNRALLLVAEYGTRLAAEGDSTPSQAIGQLINYLPIFGLSGGQMLQLDADAVLDWATAGVGATALAARWNSPLLVNVNEHTLSAVLAHPGLMDTLEQIEDFRALVQNGEQVITNTKLLKKAKRENGGQLSKKDRKTQDETAKQRKEIREKLQKFLAKIPVFMYVTDFREEALKHVIESLDSALFERVTGLTIDDFKMLSDLGLFNADHMNSAIYQFRAFERASLHYADLNGHEVGSASVGLWDRTVETDADATLPSSE